jgi:hypothetical protein
MHVSTDLVVTDAEISDRNEAGNAALIDVNQHNNRLLPQP